MDAVIENSELRTALAANIRRLRQRDGLTQAQLAKKIGISAVYMNNLEMGGKSPSAEVLFALADGLGVKADELRQISPRAVDAA
jgi:transcriptional regulator with XRE-family HTH domain